VYHSVTRAMPLLVALSALLMALAVVTLWRSFRSTQDVNKRRSTALLLIGWVIVALFSLANLSSDPHVYGISVTHVGNFINAILITFAIKRFRFLDVQIVMNRLLSFVLPAALLVVAYVGGVQP